MNKYLLSLVAALALGAVLFTPNIAEARWFRSQVYAPAYGYRSYYVTPYSSYYSRPYSYGYSPYGYGYGYQPYYNYSPYGYGYRPGGVGFSFYVR